MGEIEFGKCDICGKEAPLSRTYFIYDIHCDCCGCKEDGRDMHSELVRHCRDCVPDIPQSIEPFVKSKIDNEVYMLKIDGMRPYKIYGDFCIQKFHSNDMDRKEIIKTIEYNAASEALKRGIERPESFEDGAVYGYEFAMSHTWKDLESRLQDYWQGVREHAAIAAMQGILCAPIVEGIDPNPSKEHIAELAVAQADALIEELKKK